MTTDLRELSDRFLRGASTAEEEAALVRGLLRRDASGADSPALEPSSAGSYTAVLDRIAARVPELEREVERENREAAQLARRLETADSVAAPAAVRAAGERVAKVAF